MSQSNNKRTTAKHRKQSDNNNKEGVTKRHLKIHQELTLLWEPKNNYRVGDNRSAANTFKVEVTNLNGNVFQSRAEKNIENDCKTPWM